MKISPVQAEFFDEEGQTDRQRDMAKLMVSSRNLANGPNSTFFLYKSEGSRSECREASKKLCSFREACIRTVVRNRLTRKRDRIKLCVLLETARSLPCACAERRRRRGGGNVVLLVRLAPGLRPWFNIVPLILEFAKPRLAPHGLSSVYFMNSPICFCIKYVPKTLAVSNSTQVAVIFERSVRFLITNEIYCWAYLVRQ